MKIGTNPAIPTPASTPAPAAPNAEPAATDSFQPDQRSHVGQTLKRVLFYSTAAAIPGVGVVTNFIAGTTGVNNVLSQQKDAAQNSTRNTIASMGAGLLAAAPNVIGMVTHQTGWYLASMALGGLVGAATAYQAKN